MFRSFLTFGFFAILAAYPAAAQSDAPVPSVQTDSTAASPTPQATSSKKVWTNESLNGSDASNSPASRQSHKNAAAQNSQNKAGDPATAARIKQRLQKLQSQLADANLKLESYKKFLQGENVSYSGRDTGKGYSRTPVEQQMATLQEKKKQLELQIDALYEEARKKEIEPGQLR